MSSENTDNVEKTRADTYQHILSVHAKLNIFCKALMDRAVVHDASKLQEPELSMFAKYGAELKTLEYNSPEYKACLVRLGEALKHHYAHNTHHPEHYSNGVNGMDLLDLVEMICDWAAATERVKNGSLAKSVEVNIERFKLSDQLAAIFKNSVSMFMTKQEKND